MCKQKSHLAHECAGHRSRERAYLNSCISLETYLNWQLKNTNAYISPLPIHEYIQNKFLTCTREVIDPILSQNIYLKYVVPKAK